MRRGTLLLLLLALASCERDPLSQAVPLRLHLGFDPANCQFCQTIDMCPLDCGGEVGVRLFDVDSGTVLDKKCSEFAGVSGLVLREMPNVITGLTFDTGIAAGRRVRVEVTVFSPRSKAGGCPDIKVGSNPPRTDGADPETATYYGISRELVIPDGSAGLDAEISVGCGADHQDCATSTGAHVVAHTIDVLDGSRPPDMPEDLTVGFGRLVPSSFRHFTPELSDPALVFKAIFGREEFWETTLDRAVLDESCLVTVTQRAGDPLSYLSCEGQVVIRPGMDKKEVSVLATTVGSDLVADLLASHPDVLPHGLLIGRVVSGAASAGPGWVVSPEVGSARIQYLDDQGKIDPALTATGNTGFFVVTETPFLGDDSASCCTSFRATRPGTGLVACSVGPMGLVDGHVMAGTIDLLDQRCVSPP